MISTMPTHMIIAWSENARCRAGARPASRRSRRHHDRQAAHRGRALLLHVVLRPVVLLAEDRLTLAAVRKKVMRKRVTNSDTTIATEPAIITAITWLPPAVPRATARSSNGTTRSPMVWVVSWPLPAMTTTSPAGRSGMPRAKAMAASVGLGHNTVTVVVRAPPAMVALMIASGSSERGLSEVTTT
jgi:hypothetical protein